jgi:ATP-dependent Clp protease ATP-binding subunit ClpA
MAEIKRSILFGKRSPIAYKAIESAIIFSKMRGNPYVELVHWFKHIFQLADSDLHKISKHSGLNISRLATALYKLPRGATSISDFSPHLEEAVERGWVFGSLLFGEARVRTGHVRNLFPASLKEFSNKKPEVLTDNFAKVTGGSPEESLGAVDQAEAVPVSPGETSGALVPAPMGKQEALGQFSVDLPEKARKGEIDPIPGRDGEIRQIVDILMRRRQNNPILTGETRGTLRTIAATTWAPVLEKHQGVDLLDEALEAAARLSHRYIPSRQLPDKAVCLIDTACAWVAISQHATPTALALSETLYGGESNIITIKMSEFQEAHTFSTLKGAPPGYVGYGEGGTLTEAVRWRPYSVVLWDELEKAHPDVHEIFFQVFDKGMMEDGEGSLIDFKNTIILLTTNVGSDSIMNMCKDPEMIPSPDGVAKALRQPLLKVFPAALLGRLVVIPYYPLSDAMLRSIIRLQLSHIQKRVSENRQITFGYDDAVMDLIASRCAEVESGDRMVDAILTQTLLPEISRELLTRLMEGIPPQKVEVKVKDGTFSMNRKDFLRSRPRSVEGRYSPGKPIWSPAAAAGLAPQDGASHRRFFCSSRLVFPVDVQRSRTWKRSIVR